MEGWNDGRMQSLLLWVLVCGFYAFEMFGIDGDVSEEVCFGIVKYCFGIEKWRWVEFGRITLWTLRDS